MLVPDVLFPRTPALHTPNTGNGNHEGMIEGIMEQIARTLREYGFTPKGRARVYQNPIQSILMPYPTLTGLAFWI
jgi:hypothetical protein